MPINEMFQPDYLGNYLQNLCQQNRKLFDSPYVWCFFPEDLPLNPRRRFMEFRRTFLEIGFGHGEVLEELVLKHPDTGFMGIERRPARIKKALKRLHQVKAANALLIRINLELADHPIFAPNSFDEILINHPDPWPKRRHERHRLFRPEALDWLAYLLGPRGAIEVASDQAAYFFGILHLFQNDARFGSLLPPPFYADKPLSGRILSRFEKRVRAAGLPVWILRFAKK